MRTNIAFDIEHEGNDLEDEGMALTFSQDAEGKAHLMNLLTDLYSDKIGAAIRELACNAYDAHVEAGNDAPIEVTRPTELMPYLVIEDFGTGMSVDFLNGPFIEFGTSTKRGTDDQIGMMGIGGKSPLTLTSQFTFRTIQNGVMATVRVSRGKDGSGRVKVMDTVSTDEPDGTRFKIPVEDIDLVNRKIDQIFQWWKPETVLINGEEPYRPRPSERLDPWVMAYTGLSSDYVLMGGIAYPVRHEKRLSRVLANGLKVVVEVPMGAVVPAPSREALQDHPLTDETLDLAREWIDGAVLRKYQKQVDAAPSAVDAFHTVNAINRNKISISHTFTWHGYVIPPTGHIPVPELPYGVPEKEWEGRYCHMVFNGTYQRLTSSVYVGTLGTKWVMEGYPNKSVGKSVLAKISQWRKQNGVNSGTPIITDRETGRFSPWVPPERRFHWNDVKDLPGLNGGKEKGAATTYEVMRSKDVHNRMAPARVVTITADEVPARGRLIYLSNTDDRPYVHNQRHATPILHRLAAQLFKDATVFILPKNRWEKFVRDFPRAKHISEVHDEVRKKFVKGLTPEQRFMLAEGNRLSSNLGKLARVRDEVLDKRIRDILDLFSQSVMELRDRMYLLNKINRHLGNRQAPLEIFESPVVREQIREVEKLYPASGSGLNSFDMLEYVNALYLYRCQPVLAQPDKEA